MGASAYLPFALRAVRRKGPPVHLTLFVTGACNLRCRHCFHFAEVAAGVPGPSLADVERLAESATRSGSLLWVSFGGGEPFLRKDLPELAAAFARRGLRHLAIPTNGLVARTPETALDMARAHPETYFSVSISIDGPPDVHDAIRQVPGGHAKSLAALARLREAAREVPNLGAGILVTVTRENQDVLAAHLEELVREHRPENVTINLARGTALDESLLDVDVARYREVVAVKERLMREGALPYFDFALARVAVARDRLMYEHVARTAEGRKDGHLPCTAGTISAVVFESGDVHPCEILGRSMGNLAEFDWDIERLWNTAASDELRDEIERTRCRCTWECAQADNVLFSPRRWPALLVETLRR
ncbi:MAG: radical SAM protein [Planctomycetota bacterium]